jgi:hypothetical protein
VVPFGSPTGRDATEWRHEYMGGHHWRRLRYWKCERFDDGLHCRTAHPQGVFAGSPMNIWLRLLFLLGLSALGDGIIYVAFPWASPLRGDLISDIPTFLFLSIARPLVAGIIPIIHWAIRRSAKEALSGVTTPCAILIAVIVWLQYWTLYVRLP